MDGTKSILTTCYTNEHTYIGENARAPKEMEMKNKKETKRKVDAHFGCTFFVWFYSLRSNFDCKQKGRHYIRK